MSVIPFSKKNFALSLSLLGALVAAPALRSADAPPAPPQLGPEARFVPERSGNGYTTWDLGVDPANPGRRRFVALLNQAAAPKFDAPAQLDGSPLSWRLSDGRLIEWIVRPAQTPALARIQIPRPAENSPVRNASPMAPDGAAVLEESGNAQRLRLRLDGSQLDSRLLLGQGLRAELVAADHAERAARLVIRDEQGGEILAITLAPNGGQFGLREEGAGQYTVSLFAPVPDAGLVAGGGFIVDAAISPAGTWGGYQGYRANAVGPLPGSGINANPAGVYVGEYFHGGGETVYHFAGYLLWNLSALPATAVVTGASLSPINVNYLSGGAQAVHVYDVDNGRLLNTSVGYGYDINYWTDFKTMYGGHPEYGNFTAAASGQLGICGSVGNYCVTLNGQAVQDLNDRLRTTGYFAAGLDGASTAAGNYLIFNSNQAALQINYTDYAPNQTVINYVASRFNSAQDEVDLYNYGEAVNVGGWVIDSLDGSGSSRSFTLPSYNLPRHGRLRIINTAGTSAGDTVYIGNTPFNWASPGVRLQLKRPDTTVADSLCWGTPITGSVWNTPCIASGLYYDYDLARARDGDSDSAADWSPTVAYGAPVPPVLMAGQAGTRRRSEVFINEISVAGFNQIELANYGPPINLQGWTLAVYSFANGALSGTYTFDNAPLATGGIIQLAERTYFPVPDNWRRNLGFTVNWDATPSSGEIILRDGTGHARDYAAFGVSNSSLFTGPYNLHTPPEVNWSGPFINLGNGPQPIDVARNSDLSTLSASEWTIMPNTANLGALSPNQKGPDRVQDETGAGNSGFANFFYYGGGAAFGAGPAFTVTQQVGLEEFSVLAFPHNGPRNGLMVVKKQGAASVYFSRAVTVGDVGKTLVRSGLISPPLVLDPGNYAVMLYLDGQWYDQESGGEIERLSFGSNLGYAYEAGFTPSTAFNYAPNYGVHSFFSTVAPPLITSTASLPAGEVGYAYSSAYSSSGGYGTVRTWSVTGGALPPGLALSAAGLLSGTPSAAGVFNFTIQVQDEAGLRRTRADSITIYDALTITTTALPDGEVGIIYSQTLMASGGSGSNTWTALSGLPTDLTLYGSGLLYGTLNSSGAVSLQVQVRDGTGFATRTFNFTKQPALAITTATLPNGAVGAAYSQAIATSGGIGPLSWAITTGFPPFGLTLNPSSGVLSGVPQQSGLYSFTVRAMDSLGATASQAYSVNIVQQLAILNTSLPVGVISSPYPSAQLLAAFGTPPYNFSVTVGPLPPGLSLSSAGVISGIPTSVSSYAVTFQVTDSATPTPATATRAYTILVSDPPGAPAWAARGLYGGAINDVQISPDYPADGTLFLRGNSADIYRSTDQGANWSRLLVDPTRLGEGLNSLRFSPVYSQNSAAPDASTIFVSSGPLGVWKSTDHGNSFVASNTGLPGLNTENGPGASALAISPAYVSDRTLWVGAYNVNTLTLYKSTNAGGNWIAVATFPAAVTSAILQIVPSPAFAADRTLFMIIFGEVYRSGDAGSTWAKIFTPPTDGGFTAYAENLVISPNYANDQAVFVEDTGHPALAHRVFRSRNGGGTFAALGSRGYNFTVAARPRQTPLYFMKSPQASYTLYQSDNGGDSFTDLYGFGMKPNGVIRESALAVSPLLAGGGVDIFSGTHVNFTGSFDGGFSFIPRQQGITAVKGTAISGAGNVVVAASEGGWLKSANLGTSWVNLQNSAGLGSSVTYLSAVSPDYANDRVIFLEAGLAGLWRSANGGQSFSRVLFDDPLVLNFAPGFTGAGSGLTGTMFVGTSNGLYKSTDGGNNFTTITLPSPTCLDATRPSVESLAVSPRFNTDGTIFTYGRIVGANGGICKSVDGGLNWTRLLVSNSPIGGTISLPPNYFNNAANGSVDKIVMRVESQYSTQGVYRSTDGGTSWALVGGQPAYPNGILTGQVVFSPLFQLDGTAFVTINRAFGGANGLLRSSDFGANFARLSASDALASRTVNGLYLAPAFDGRNNANAVAIASTYGAGLWRSSDGGRTFQSSAAYKSASNLVNGLARAPGGLQGLRGTAPQDPSIASGVSGGSLLLATQDQGVFQSDDGGLTFNNISTGLPPDANATSIAVPLLAAAAPLASVSDLLGAPKGLWRYNGAAWSQQSGGPVSTTGTYTSFAEDGTYLYAARADGVSLRSSDGGATWIALDAAQTDLVKMDYNAQSTPTLALDPAAKKQGPPAGPFTPNTTALWGVSQASGPRYSIDNGANWIASPGSNDYALPVAGGWSVVKALGINPTTLGREVVIGNNNLLPTNDPAKGLFLSRDGGLTWRNVTGPGSGLNLTSKNVSAVLSSTTAYNTDVLVGLSGPANGGVYLSSDAGEHWLQVNTGLDPSALSISALIATNCTGCPTQYYAGMLADGVTTRNIQVAPPPAFPVANYSCYGATPCSCVTGGGSGPEQGGQAFQLCGSNFKNGVVVEFDGIPAAGCTQSGGTVITCTGTPPHVPGFAKIRVRNPDTRVGYLPAQYTYTTGTSRATGLLVAKSGGNAALTWACAGCTAGNPARVYRAQNVAFSAYLEQYNGGTGGAFTNTGAVSSAQSYFWSVE